MGHAISILIVAYNGVEDLAACLAPIAKDFPVVVVDNSSNPQVRRAVEEHGAQYVDSGANIGFAAGVNLGAQHIDPSHDILLLNPDAVIEPAIVSILHGALRSDAGLAAVTGRLTSADGTEERVGWPFPTPGRMWLEALGLARFAPAPTEFVIGATLLLRREALDDVGALDERFFLYAEETDWQRRASQRGWAFRVVTNAVARHRGAGTSADQDQRERLFHAGTETYIRKWFGAGGWANYRIAALSGAAIRSILGTDPGRRQARRRFRLYLRGPRRAAALP